ncbi:unnamed protein product [Closterium sp. NIES-54]
MYTLGDRCSESNSTSAGYAMYCAAAVSCGGNSSDNCSHGPQAEPLVPPRSSNFPSLYYRSEFHSRRLGAAATTTVVSETERTSPGCTVSPSSVSCPGGFAATDGREGGEFVLNGHAYIADADQGSPALVLGAPDGGIISASSAEANDSGFAGSAFTSAALSTPLDGEGLALSFSARFTFQLEGQNEADVATGLAFVITGGPNTAVGPPRCHFPLAHSPLNPFETTPFPFPFTLSSRPLPPPIPPSPPFPPPSSHPSPSLASDSGAAFNASLAVVLSGRPPLASLNPPFLSLPPPPALPISPPPALPATAAPPSMPAWQWC